MARTGNGAGAGARRKFLPFKQALVFARSLKLKCTAEWKVWSKSGGRKANIPSTPEKSYKHAGWQGYGHWLGTDNKRTKVFLPFKQALVFVRSLKLKTKAEWIVWCKSGGREANIHSNPARNYKHEGWQGYGHWLGTGNVRGGNGQQFLPFKKALVHARTLKLTNMKDWEAWCKSGVREDNMPSRPDLSYKHDGWQSYGHWLGTGNAAPKDKQFLPFKQALVYARSLKLKGKTEWVLRSKSGGREPNIPSNPDKIYKHDGWQGYGHWLGTGNVATKDTQFLPFKQALVYARFLDLKSLKEWQDWAKTVVRPANMPSAPDKYYKNDGWQGYGHWLGTGNLAGGCKLDFLPFKQALLYARTLKLKGVKEWRDWDKTGVRPANIPSCPDKMYKHNGWQGYGHWLGGTGTVAPHDKQFLPFNTALLCARSLKLKYQTEWRDWAKTGVRPSNMPSAPDVTYKHDGWQGYGHWLGTGHVHGGNVQEFLLFDKALLYARCLKLESETDWRVWCKSGACPVNIPFTPQRTYKHDGWQGYGHWLGTL